MAKPVLPTVLATKVQLSIVTYNHTGYNYSEMYDR